MDTIPSHTDFGGTDTQPYDSETCEAFHYFGYPMLSMQFGTPSPALSRVNSCDSIYFDAISTPHHSPSLRPHNGLGHLSLSMTPMMPIAPPSSGAGHLNLRPKVMRSRSNSIPVIELNSHHSATTPANALAHAGNNNKSTPMQVSPLKPSKSTVNLTAFVPIKSDIPIQYPLSRKERLLISQQSGSSAKNPRGGLFYRLILRPNSIFMRIAATQQGARQKVVKVVKGCADKMRRTDMKTLMYWVMALIMLRGEVWQLIAATAVKVLTVVGEGEDLLL